MIGLLGFISQTKDFGHSDYNYLGNRPFLEDEYHFKTFHIKRKLNDKFFNDKLFQEDQDFFVAVDGVLLNAKQLKQDFAIRDNFNLIKHLYLKEGKQFINTLKGDFSLVLYNKTSNELIVYTNTTTSKPIYYHFNKDLNEFYFGSNVYELSKCLKAKGIKLTVNEFAFYSVASFDYVYGNHHFSNEIKKLGGGQFIVYNTKEDIKIETYFRLSSYPQLNLTEDEYLHKINEKFEQAIRLQYDKDLEYNYKHISTLSGGLDSRMTTLVGHKLGYKAINTITFSSPNYWDEIIAKQIAKKFKLNNFLYKIDSGNHLKEFDFSLHVNGGLLSYFVANQIHDFYNKIDFASYGLIHTGQVGDAIVGSTLHNYNIHFKYGYINPKYKEYFSSKLENAILKEMIVNDSLEMTRFYNHVFNFTLEGNQYAYPYTETVSPFMERDFLQFCIRIPLKFRNNHNLYYKWIGRFHPELGKFYYEKIKRRTLNISNKRFRKAYHIMYMFYLKRLGLKEKNNALLNYAAWRQSGEIESNLNDLFNINIEAVKDEELKNSLIKQYEQYNFQVKLKALHAVLTYKLYF
ncbi:hypothetical protein ACFPH8_08975 [Bizionia hallyeonensis]|uniref:asparagine synthase (glutamine-hydrolyzing) n=1 Tax=Bizionia hallyeonensis TaxID=1123757 RepID=A0ABW0C615_9FLAO